MTRRAIDVAISLLSLIILSPVLLATALFVAARIGRPALFVQQRAGRGGHPFAMHKFRTMTEERDAEGNLLPDCDRLTPAGQLLRRTSLDELPGLVSILRGDMSIVGPRPLLMRYLPRYSAEQSRRHNVRPGLTGLAQVNGRNALSWDERLALDCWYVDRRTPFLDLCIVLRTVIRVFDHSGIASVDSATMSEFMGSRDTGLSSKTVVVSWTGRYEGRLLEDGTSPPRQC